MVIPADPAGPGCRSSPPPTGGVGGALCRSRSGHYYQGPANTENRGSAGPGVQVSGFSGVWMGVGTGEGRVLEHSVLARIPFPRHTDSEACAKATDQGHLDFLLLASVAAHEVAPGTGRASLTFRGHGLSPCHPQRPTAAARPNTPSQRDLGTD